jgi:hypothetical protein
LDLFVAECLYFAGVGADACRAVISGDAYSSGKIYSV